MLGVWHTLFQPTLDEIAQLMNLSLHLQVNHLQPCLLIRLKRVGHAEGLETCILGSVEYRRCTSKSSIVKSLK